MLLDNRNAGKRFEVKDMSLWRQRCIETLCTCINVKIILKSEKTALVLVRMQRRQMNNVTTFYCHCLFIFLKSL